MVLGFRIIDDNCKKEKNGKSESVKAVKKYSFLIVADFAG